MSRDFLIPVFFIKHLLLFPLDTPRKDFEFFRIFEELFEFVIDSLVYSSPGSWDSPVVNTPGSRSKLVNKKPSSAKYSKESRLPCVYYTWESWLPDSLVYYSRENFFVNLFLCLLKVHKEVDSPGFHHRGVETPLCIHHRGVETPRCIHHRGVETRRYIHHWGVILDTGESFYWF